MEAKKRIRLKVASPCNADWNSMKGDDAVRHCGSCSKNVYQLSNMSSEQVEELLAQSDDLCGRFYQRKDGTLMTSDCAVGVRRKRRKQAVLGAGMGVLSAIGVAFSGSSPAASSAPELPVQHIPSVVEIPVLETVEEPEPEPVPEVDELEIDEEEYYPKMGKIAYVPDEEEFDLPGESEPLDE